jgi:hypothetical protein
MKSLYYINRRTLLRRGGLVISGALLAACAPAPAPPAAEQPATVVEEALAVPTATVADAPAATALPADRPFQPVDPETVVLAAGRPQLVEFFNFW